ncbi:hypothetical protein C1I60_12805 [Paenibacillus terrae]|uniref:Uncharacterized protein n=1 Tax=Paenibacillus terrae TaxID=159743 RepID=A0A4U2Q3G8_9BACL|nr:hypothetical protein C1I60_12805 [Paenibacillus terrae]
MIQYKRKNWGGVLLMPYKKATFWFSVISILICLNNYLGNDDKNVLLIGLNPLLNSIVYTEPFRHWIFDFDSAKLAIDSVTIKVQFPTYIIHFISFFLTGLIIDFLRRLVGRKVKRS